MLARQDFHLLLGVLLEEEAGSVAYACCTDLGVLSVCGIHQSSPVDVCRRVPRSELDPFCDDHSALFGIQAKLLDIELSSTDGADEIRVTRRTALPAVPVSHFAGEELWEQNAPRSTYMPANFEYLEVPDPGDLAVMKVCPLLDSHVQFMLDYFGLNGEEDRETVLGIEIVYFAEGQNLEGKAVARAISVSCHDKLDVVKREDVFW